MLMPIFEYMGMLFKPFGSFQNMAVLLLPIFQLQYIVNRETMTGIRVDPLEFHIIIQ
jgi:hypothetical protein